MEEIGVLLFDHLVRLDPTDSGGLNFKDLVVAVDDDRAQVQVLHGHLTGVAVIDDLDAAVYAMNAGLLDT